MSTRFTTKTSIVLFNPLACQWVARMSVTSGSMRRLRNRGGQTTGLSTTWGIVARRGQSIRVAARLPGALKRLPQTRMPMPSALAHCITSGSMPTNRHRLPTVQSVTLRLARRCPLKSKPQARAAVAHLHLHRRPVQHLRLQQRQVRLQLQRPHQQLQLRRLLQPQPRQLRRRGLLPRPGRIRYPGHVQRRVPDREGVRAGRPGGTRCPQRVGKRIRLCRLIFAPLSSPLVIVFGRSRSTFAREWIDDPRPVFRSRA